MNDVLCFCAGIVEVGGLSLVENIMAPSHESHSHAASSLEMAFASSTLYRFGVFIQLTNAICKLCHTMID